jgi:cytochrome c
MTNARHPLIFVGIALSALCLSSGALAFDEAAAKALAKRNDCTKCHAIDKDKKGPSFKKIASKNAGKADAEDKLSKAITTSSKVKLSDGSEEEHKVIDTKDPKEIKNLVQWILSL